jgi:hypothetical protein
VEAIPMTGWQVIVTEQRTPGVLEREPISYISPPQTEQQARSLIALLAGTSTSHERHWRCPVAGGQRIIQLRAAE